MRIRNKNIKLLISLLGVLLLLGIAGCTSANDDSDTGQNIQLNFATFWPAEDFQVTEGHQNWAAEIENRVKEETEHTVTINFHTGGSLLGATDIYEGVASGAADLGSTCPSYTPGVFPASSVVELPGFMNDDALVASLTIQEAYETIEAIQNEYSDVKVMHFWATGPGDILSTVPINSLDEIRGLEIRVAGGSVPAMEALGAQPVSMPMSEAYIALDQGIVKGLLGPTDILKGFRLAEVTNYIVKTPWLYNIVFVKVMNQDTWNSLPVDVQKIFNETNAKFVTEYGNLRTQYTTDGQSYAVKEMGHQVIELSSDEEVKWLMALSNVQGKWIQDVTRYGLDGEGLLESVIEIDAKHSKK